MEPDTRQTSIGVVCITIISGVAVSQGLNGSLTAVALLCVVALITPEALDKLPTGDDP